MGRQRFLVCYDICNPRRLRRVEKIVRAFGTRLQFSIFECLLDDMNLQKLRGHLAETINTEHDQVMFVTLGPASGTSSFRIDTLGLPYTIRSRVVVL